MFWVLLGICFIKFWSSERNKENTIIDLYFNEESHDSEENTCDNEVFRSTILQPFQFDESHEKETKHIHASAADLLQIRMENLDWCKCGQCKNEVREIEFLFCREVDESYCFG